MSAHDLVRVATADGVARVHMCDEAGGNALSPEMVGALVEGLDAAAADEAARVILLLGGHEHFSTGATRGLLEALGDGSIAPTELTLATRLLALPIPVIGVAEGSAIGGGFALLLACDLVMIAREGRYGTNFMALGITPGMGSTRLLESTLSPALAHELLYAADLRRGESFEGRSGFNAILPRAELLARAEELAWTIAEHPRENLTLLKRTLTLPRRRAVLEALSLEATMHEISLPRLDTRAMT